MKSHYEIKFNGKSTWFIVTVHGDCVFSTDTERKAKNRLAKIFRLNGLA